MYEYIKFDNLVKYLLSFVKKRDGYDVKNVKIEVTWKLVLAHVFYFLRV